MDVPIIDARDLKTSLSAPNFIQVNESYLEKKGKVSKKKKLGSVGWFRLCNYVALDITPHFQQLKEGNFWKVD